MKISSHLGIGLTLAALGIASAGSVAAAEPLRCSHQLPPKHHIAQVIDRWAAEVETLSAGEIDVQVFGANALVGAKQNIPSVAKGNIECAFSVNFQWGKTLPLMNVTLKPYAVTDLETLAAWPDSEAYRWIPARAPVIAKTSVGAVSTSGFSATP